MRTFAGIAFVLIVVVLINVYRRHGSYGVRSWLKAKFLNAPDPARKAAGR